MSAKILIGPLGSGLDGWSPQEDVVPPCSSIEDGNRDQLATWALTIPSSAEEARQPHAGSRLEVTSISPIADLSADCHLLGLVSGLEHVEGGCLVAFVPHEGETFRNASDGQPAGPLAWGSGPVKFPSPVSPLV